MEQFMMTFVRDVSFEFGRKEGTLNGFLDGLNVGLAIGLLIIVLFGIIAKQKRGAAHVD